MIPRCKLQSPTRLVDSLALLSLCYGPHLEKPPQYTSSHLPCETCLSLEGRAKPRASKMQCMSYSAILYASSLRRLWDIIRLKFAFVYMSVLSPTILATTQICSHQNMISNICTDLRRGILNAQKIPRSKG